MQASKFEAVTRFGFGARGLTYILIGYLALKSGRTESAEGALEYLNSGSGKLLLGIMAVGFLAYGIWRVSEAVIDTESKGTEPSGLALRAAGFVSGLIHLGLAFTAARLATDSAGGGDSANHAEQGAATTLALPGGQTLLTIIAAVLLVNGLYQFVKAWRLRFLRHLEQRAAQQPWVRWTGGLGYAARGFVFLIIAYFLWNAARAGSAEQAGDMGEALQSLPQSWQMIIAAGLILFGIFSLVEALYRRINDPHVIDRLASTARSATR